MSKRKICVVLTTRGNYAKMLSIMEGIVACSDMELQLIVGGGILLPKYGFDLDKHISSRFQIHRKIHFLVEGENPVTMAKSAGIALSEFTTAFDDLKPDFVIVIADRFECLPIAIAASYINIPVVHIEGGEVSGSIDESVRHAITKMSHLHFPATEGAAKRIQRLGEDPSLIFTVGCTSLDLIRRMDLQNIAGLMQAQIKLGVGPVVDLIEPYLLVIQHPVTTEYEENFANVNETIAAVEAMGMGTIWIWPNSDAGSDGISKGIRVLREAKNPNNFHFFKSLPIELYAPLLKNSKCIVGNSSSGIREASFLGVPSVNIGTRQSGRDKGPNVLEVSNNRKEILKAVKRQIEHGHYEPNFLYGDGKAGIKIVNVLQNIHLKAQKHINY